MQGFNLSNASISHSWIHFNYWFSVCVSQLLVYQGVVLSILFQHLSLSRKKVNFLEVVLSSK